MPIPYDHLYNYLVGQVDDVIQYMVHTMLVERAVDYDHMRVAAEKLRAALETCEERYLAAEDTEEDTAQLAAAAQRQERLREIRQKDRGGSRV